MTIQEILEAHDGYGFDPVGDSMRQVCMCGTDCGQATRNPDGVHRAHVSEVLDKHMQEREAEAVRETARYIERIFPRKGLVNRADILADIEIAADRLGRGIHANGREKETPNGR